MDWRPIWTLTQSQVSVYMCIWGNSWNFSLIPSSISANCFHIFFLLRCALIDCWYWKQHTSGNVNQNLFSTIYYCISALVQMYLLLCMSAHFLGIMLCIAQSFFAQLKTIVKETMEYTVVLQYPHDVSCYSLGNNLLQKQKKKYCHLSETENKELFNYARRHVSWRGQCN